MNRLLVLSPIASLRLAPSSRAANGMAVEFGFPLVFRLQTKANSGSLPYGGGRHRRTLPLSSKSALPICFKH
jgi:hypothetical protein